MALPSYIRSVDDGTRLDVFVQPRAARDGFAGIHGDALKLKVRAPALEGKANRGVVDLLARALDVPRSRLQIVSGEKSRNKGVMINGVAPDVIAAKLAEASLKR